PRSKGMDRPGHHFLSRSAPAQNEHRGIPTGYFPHGGHDALHCRGSVHRLEEWSGNLGPGAAFTTLHLDHPPHDMPYDVFLEGFGDVVDGTSFYRLHRVWNCPVRRDEQERYCLRMR